jgi:hypothetical protein
MSRLRFLVHKYGADATNDICDELADLGMLMCHIDKTQFKPRAGDVMVNWGVINRPDEYHWASTDFKWLNHPQLVRRSGNRLKSLPIMKEAGVNVPEFTTQFDVAKGWLNDGSSVIARANVRSRSGHGLTFVEPSQELPSGQALYVRYVPKKVEYRVHVFRGAVIDVQQKKRRKGFTGQVDPKIRSYDNGWVFCRQGVQAPECVLTQSLAAVSSLGLDFGATDVGWNEMKQEAMIYEVNTAPGLEGTTTKKYAQAIREYYNHAIG